MDIDFVKKYLQENLGFSDVKIDKLEKYVDLLLIFNKKYNLISKSTEKEIWNRHILDSAQIVQYIDFNKDHILSDLGSGAGLPGIVLSIANHNRNFHVKLYEKSPVKRSFLSDIQKITKFDIEVNVYDYNIIQTDYIVCRAFKKLDLILDISREKVKNPHKLIILKGKNALNDLKKLPKDKNYRYKIVDSITDKDSKIIIATKNGK
tara:strand:- start:45 stop:662 length:618 start_codon:yes stop_codon:yes gene_type:complete